MTPAADDVCCFCGRPEDAAVPGELAALLTAARPRLKALRFHEACAGYSTGIAAGRLVGGSRTREPWRHGEIPAQRVAAERSRGASLECDVCGGRGATLACRGIAACGRSYHLPCAREAAQRGGVVFSLGVLECACAQHADGIPDPIPEPAGLWFEKFGGWDNQSPEVEQQWAAQQHKRQRLAHTKQEGAELGGGRAAGAESRLAPAPAAPAEGKALKEVDGEIWLDSSSDEEDEGGEGAAAAPAAWQAPLQQGVPPSKPGAASEAPSRPSWRPSKPRLEAEPQQSPASSLEMPSRMPRELRRLQEGVRQTRQGGRQQQQMGGAAAAAAAGLEDSSEVEDALPSPAEQRAPAAPPLSEEEEVAAMQQEVRDVRRSYLLPGHTWVQGGDVLGPPPRAEGSLVVLNTVIPYPTAFRRVTREYVHRMRTSRDQSHPQVAVVRNEHLLDDHNRRRVRDSILAFIRRGAKLGRKGKLTPQKLPEVLPMAECGERFRIQADDPRVGLAQDTAPLGWRNKVKGKTVPRFTVLGAYQSLQLLNFSYQEMIHDTELAQQMELPPSQLSLCCEAYGADSGVGGHEGVLCGQEHLLGPLFTRFRQVDEDLNNLTYSAWGIGNATALINDIAVDPFGELQDGKQALTNLPGGPNCMFVEALVFGWPFLFVVTTQDVPAGAEFLLEYGKQYWAAMRREKLRSRATEAEQAALRQRLEAAQRVAMEAQAAEQRATSTQPVTAEPHTSAKLAGLETQASGTAAAGPGAVGNEQPDGAAPAPAAAAAPAAAPEAAATQPTAAPPAVPAQEAAGLAAQGSAQGSPLQQPAEVEGCATSPGPRLDKPLRIPQAAGSQRPGSSQQHRSPASASKRGSERRRSRSRDRRRSRSRRRSRDRSRSRSRSRRRRASRSRCRSRDRRRRSRSRSRIRGRGRPRSPPQSHAYRPGSGGSKPAASGWDGQRGGSPVRSRAPAERSAGAAQREQGAGAWPLQRQVSGQAGGMVQTQHMPLLSPVQEPAPQHAAPQPPVAHALSSGFFWQHPEQAPQAWPQQDAAAAAAVPPAAVPAAGGWADSPRRPPLPRPEDGGTPDLAEIEEQEAAAAAAQPQRSETPDLLELEDEGLEEAYAPPVAGPPPGFGPAVGPPPGFGLPQPPIGPPGWQGQPPAAVQPYFQQPPIWQPQQPPYGYHQPAPAPPAQHPGLQRARSATPDLGPAEPPAQMAQQAQQARQRQRSATPDLGDAQPQAHPTAQPAQQRGHPGHSTGAQQPAAAGWRQPTGAWAQRPQHGALPASPGAAAGAANAAAAGGAAPAAGIDSQAWPSSRQAAASSRPHWPLPRGAGSGRVQQHHQAAQPPMGQPHAASGQGAGTGAPPQPQAAQAAPAGGMRAVGMAAARAALPEPQAVGRPGSYRERHAATAFGLKAPQQHQGGK